MNDYWNDLPEEPEVPECCEMEMECDRNGVLWCKNCGAQIEPDPEPNLLTSGSATSAAGHTRASANLSQSRSARTGRPPGATTAIT